MEIVKTIAPRFEDYIFDWDYEKYLLVGGYGSGKSYNTAFKLILKLLQEKRKALVIREVYATLEDTCYDLIKEILEDMDLLDEFSGSYAKAKQAGKVFVGKSPFNFRFPNGSKIIFKGMDKTAKVKSLNGVSIVWLEECSEIKYEGYLEMLGRIRTPDVSMHFILTTNPIGRENWVYRHFFTRLSDSGIERVILPEGKFYNAKTIIKNGTYYHHSTVDDNPFAPKEYIKRLDEILSYDPPLHNVARYGKFGASGVRVLPQLTVARNAKEFTNKVKAIDRNMHFYGMDFGFETSYNAVISMAVDDKEKILYIYDEIYKNHITDDQFAVEPKMLKLKNKDVTIVADNEDPKAIKYYRQTGYKMRACRNKFAGSRLSNTRKIKRFKKIVCSPKCINTIRELRELTYRKDAKGNTIYDEFNIDPHTFSAIWYALDNYTVADVKKLKVNSKKG